MSRRSKKKITNRAKLVITVVLIAICLLVMHKFEFLTKSEEVITTNVEFIEYGTENSMKSDLELFVDENNNSYIVLPENVNGYLTKKYYIYSENVIDLEEIQKQENNIISENIIENNTTSTNSVDNIEGNIAPKNELNNTNTVENELNNTNTVENELNKQENLSNTNEVSKEDDLENEKDKEASNIVTNEVSSKTSNEINSVSEENIETTNEEENTNSVVQENKILEENDSADTEETNTATNSGIVENKVTNKVETNTAVENIENNKEISNSINKNQVTNEVTNVEKENDENIVIENTNTVVISENGVNVENNEDKSEKTLKEFKAGDRIYLTQEQLEKEDLSIFAEYQTIEINGVKLYNQELISESAEAKIVVTGYVPSGYGLNVKAEDINEIEELKSDVEELKDTKVLAAYDIKILNGDVEYQPKDYYQTVNVAITSTEKFQDNLIGKTIEVLHINENEEEILFEKINVSNKTTDTVECITNEFSRYAVIKVDEITPDRVLVSNYDNDYNYYMGLNYTEGFTGRETPYTENDFAEVTVNYYGYNINKTEMNQIETNSVTWLRTEGGTSGTNQIINVDITATFGDGQYIDTTKPWIMSFNVPTSGRFNFPATASDSTNNDITITYDESTTVVTVTGNNWNSWTQNSYKKYTLDMDLVYSETTTVPGYSGAASYGFVVKGTERQLKGYISTVQPTADTDGERQTLMTYTHAVPISGGNVSVELIDNPFMDRPGGAGFNGWLSADVGAAHTITTNTNNFVQTLTTAVGADRKVTINLYADWKDANVIFVDGTAGNNNNEGSMTSPVLNWTGINTRLGSSYSKSSDTNTVSDRELNIIVLMNGTLTNLQAETNSPYTLTSIYAGQDYRDDTTFTVSSYRVLEQDVQLAFLTVDGPANYDGTGMNADTAESATSNLGSYVIADTYNFRIGRGMMPESTATSEATFTQIQGGGTTNSQYKLVVETGKYLNIQVGRAGSINEHTRNAIAVVGNDFDRVNNNNDDLHIYTKFSSRTGGGTANPINSTTPVYHMIVKSGTIGVDCFKNTNTNKPYAGIYLGGHGYAGSDTGDRVLTIEGGRICNIVGGLGTSNGTSAKTYIQVKGGTVANIVGGAGRSPTYGDRCIQVTDGTILYSVNGGSNGVASTTSDNGTLNGNTKIYIGGNAIIGAADTYTGNTTTTDEGIATLYGTEAGCVLGAGNGNDNPNLMGIAGRVYSSHIIIDGNATVNNSVYGGGNYGVVNSTVNSGNSGEPVVNFVDKTNDIVSGETYIIANGTTVGSSRVLTIGEDWWGDEIVSSTTLTNTSMPSNDILWRVEKDGDSYILYNIGSGKYLNNNNSNNIGLSTDSREFTGSSYNGGIRLYFYRNSRNRYIRITNNGASTTTTANSATAFRFLQAVKIERPDDEEPNTAVTIEVQGGTVKKNVYGGSNQSNIVGAVSIKTYNGNVNGAIYGGSNIKGEISQDTFIYIKGGKIGTTGAEIKDIIFGGGLGDETTVSGDATIDISDANSTVVLNGNIYGGSQAGIVSGDSEITVSDSKSAANTITITGNIFGGGKGEVDDPATTNGNVTVMVDGGTYPGLSVFGGCNINGEIGGDILVEIGKTYLTKVNEIYGAGNQAEVTTNTNSVQVDIFSNATAESAFNGGNEAGIAGTNIQVPRKITVDGGNVTNLYGGSNAEGELQETYVYVKNNATIENAYGGGLGVDTNISGNTLLDINDSTITSSAYGGGSKGPVEGNTDVNVINSNINDSLYGGGQEASVATTDVDIEGSNIANNIYGGGENGSVTGNTNGKSTDVYMKDNSQAGNVFGGGEGQSATIAANTSVTIETSNVVGDKEAEDATNPAVTGNVYGGGDKGQVNGNTKISITDSSNITNNIFGGGNQAGVLGTTDISIENSIVGAIYGGGNAGDVTGVATITSLGSQVDKNVYGGGNQGEVNSNTYVTISDSVDDNGNTLNISNIGGSVYGGGRAANVNGTQVFVQNKTLAQNIYGGGEYGEVETSTDVFIEDSTIANSVYGGGKGTDASADGTLPGQVKGNCSLEITNNSVIQNRVFGAGEGITAEVGGDTLVDFKENSFTGDDIYGGGDNGPVKGTTKLFISSGKIGGNAYAAGNGVTALVSETSYLGIDGDTTITKSAFGGGNAAETGEKYVDSTTKEETGDALVVVDIAGAVIGENVYGGANSSVIYGSTVINIGQEAINNYYGTNAKPKNFVKGKVDIGGTIFGGGEQMDPTKEFNYDTISVTKTILINIDGEGYETSETDTNTFNFYESVFGSGNASSANTNGDINIRNYGTREKPKRGISIQRATDVVMDNSSILLNGTTDSTSAHPEGLFALNRIAHLKIKNDTTLYLVNGANLLAHYSSMVGDDGSEEYATVEIIDTVVGENGTSYEVINGKIYDGDDVKYYVSNGAIYEPNTTGIGEDIEITKIATVQNATTINKNTDNRIYMYSGRNLNISDDEEVTSKYGDVKGMTFFGIFKSSDGGESNPDDENSVYMGMYDPNYTTGGTVDWNERNFNRSYVLGLHERNPEQDISKDGFYTVYEKLGVELGDNDILTEDNYSSYNPTSYTSYITPTPKDDVYYMWYAGPDDEVFYYTFTLTASKHSTFGTKELSLLGISYENAILTLTSVDASLVNGVGLYDKNDIPNINTDQDAANNKFGLTMKTSTSGWSMTGSTDIYADAITDTNNTNNTSYDGTNKYTIENLKTTPAFVFFLYHSNNITEARELGTVQINMGLSYWRDALNRGNARVIIDAILLSEVYDDTGYNGAIAPGSHYDLFANTVTNITTESSFSTYFEFAQENFSQIENIKNYYEDSYRVITTEYAFPAGTTITMIDRWNKNNPAYYYYDVTEKDHEDGKVEYKLSEFKVMGSSNEKFDEKIVRENYHITENNMDYEYENFIFIANFENAQFPELPDGEINITRDQHFRMYLKTIIDGREEILFGLLDDQIDSIVYGIYDTESTIDLDATISKSRVFLGNDVSLKVNTIYDVKKGEQSVTIYDTRYFDKKLGVKLTFYKKNDDTKQYEIVNGANLLGTYFELNGEKYYPRADGTTRIKIAELVSNASSKIKIGTENSALPTGEYQIKIESFGSADGIYYGVEASATAWVSLELINDVYGLNSKLPVEQVIIDKATGVTLNANTGKIDENGNNKLNFSIEYLSGLNNPYITVSLYRREYDESMNNPYQNSYTKVDLTDYVTTKLEVPHEINQEYAEEDQEFIDSIKQFERDYKALDTDTIKAAVIDNTISVTLKLDYELKKELMSGTYKVVFTLYDASDVIVYKEEKDENGEVISQKPFSIREYTYVGDTFSYIIIK